MNNYGTERVVCPFFKDYQKHTIRCEGYLEGRNLITTFEQAEDRSGQMRIFCCEHYEKCEVYRMVMESKYDG